MATIPKKKNLANVLDIGNSANASKITELWYPTDDNDAASKRYVDERVITAWAWDVVWPASATDNAIALFNWVTWKSLKDSAKTIVTTLWSTDTTIPTSKAVKDVTDTKMSGNTAITWATKTKITYDSKGLVTSWDDATTADIAASTDKNYVTDAEKTSIWTIWDKINISETNSLVVHTMRSDNTWINYVNTTWAVQISLDWLFWAWTNFGGKMRLEIQSTSFTATLMIEWRYDAASHTWTYWKATIETSSTSSINVRFARSASWVFLIVWDTTTAWSWAKFAIAEVLFNTPNALTWITFSTIWSYPTDIDFLVTPVLNTWNETATTIWALINWSTAATPNDTDIVATSDTSVLKKITWTNVKSFLKTYFDTVYANIAGSVTQAFSASTIELWHATDTTISRVSAGVIAVEWVNVIMNWWALGTPSSGTLSGCTVDGTNKVGYLNIPQNSQSAAYTTVLADAGKHIYHPSADTTARTITIDSNANVAYPIGTALTFVNDTSAGTLTIAITSDTLVLAGAGTTGSRTLAANGVATAIKVTSTRWIISGTNLT